MTSKELRRLAADLRQLGRDIRAPKVAPADMTPEQLTRALRVQLRDSKRIREAGR